MIPLTLYDEYIDLLKHTVKNLKYQHIMVNLDKILG